MTILILSIALGVYQINQLAQSQIQEAHPTNSYDGESLQSILHTVSYEDSTSRGGSFPFRKPPRLLKDQDRSSAIASIITHIKDIRKQHGESGSGPDMLYFKCQLPTPKAHLPSKTLATGILQLSDYDPASMTEPFEITKSLILQYLAILLARESPSKIGHAIYSICRLHPLQFTKLLQSTSPKSSSQLFSLLLSLLEKKHSPCYHCVGQYGERQPKRQ